MENQSDKQPTTVPLIVGDENGPDEQIEAVVIEHSRKYYYPDGSEVWCMGGVLSVSDADGGGHVVVMADGSVLAPPAGWKAIHVENI